MDSIEVGIGVVYAGFQNTPKIPVGDFDNQIGFYVASLWSLARLKAVAILEREVSRDMDELLWEITRMRTLGLVS